MSFYDIEDNYNNSSFTILSNFLDQISKTIENHNQQKTEAWNNIMIHLMGNNDIAVTEQLKEILYHNNNNYIISKHMICFDVEKRNKEENILKIPEKYFNNIKITDNYNNNKDIKRKINKYKNNTKEIQKQENQNYGLIPIIENEKKQKGFYRTAYSLFVQDVMKRIHLKYPHLNMRKCFQKASIQWKLVPNEVREKYKRIYEKEKQKHFIYQKIGSH